MTGYSEERTLKSTYLIVKCWMRGNLLSDTILFIIAGATNKKLSEHTQIRPAISRLLTGDTFSLFLSHAASLERDSVPVPQSLGGVCLRSAQWFSDLMLRELIQLLFEEVRSKMDLKRFG